MLHWSNIALAAALGIILATPVPADAAEKHAKSSRKGRFFAFGHLVVLALAHGIVLKTGKEVRRYPRILGF